MQVRGVVLLRAARRGARRVSDEAVVAALGARRRALAGATSSSSYSGTSAWLTTMKYVIPGGRSARNQSRVSS